MRSKWVEANAELELAKIAQEETRRLIVKIVCKMTKRALKKVILSVGFSHSVKISQIRRREKNAKMAAHCLNFLPECMTI